MPTISRFFGITIRIYHDDHPPPHFHAYYGEYGARINIETLRITEGQLPRRVLGMVFEWAADHRDEIHRNWDLAHRHQELVPISPLN